MDNKFLIKVHVKIVTNFLDYQIISDSKTDIPKPKCKVDNIYKIV